MPGDLSVLLVLDLVGTFATLGIITAVGGGGLLAFLFSRALGRWRILIHLVDAAGLSLFAVAGGGTARDLP